MRFSKTAVAVVVMAIVAAMGAQLTAKDQLKPALEAGGVRLASLQYSDGGWFWTAPDTDCAGAPGVQTCANLFGVNGLGLLAAYDRTKNDALLLAAIKTGDTLVLKYMATPPGDGNPATFADRPYAQDIEFLVALAKASKDKNYREIAELWYGNIMLDFPNPVDRAANRLSRGNPYKTLRGWDAASDIRAAHAVGFKDYAEGVAAEVISRWTDWDYDDPYLTTAPGFGAGWENIFRMLSRGSMLWALGELNKKQFKATEIDYRTYLLGIQETGGSWGFGDGQNTSYILLGLLKGERSKVPGKDLKDASEKAAGFLLSMQMTNGGFLPWDGAAPAGENTEVNSEVLQALAEVHGKIN